MWIAKIRTLIDGRKQIDTISPSTSFVVSLIDNEFSRKLHMQGIYGLLNIETFGIVINDVSSKGREVMFTWDELLAIDILDCVESIADTNKIVVINTNSCFHGGIGTLHLFNSTALCLTKLANSVKATNIQKISYKTFDKRLSKSEGNLAFDMIKSKRNWFDSGVVTTSKENVKWYIDAKDNVDIKHSSFIEDSPHKGKISSMLVSAAKVLGSPGSQRGAISSIDIRLSSSPKKDNLSPETRALHIRTFHRRCSGTSIASGIYEEISEDIPKIRPQDNTYEAVSECRSGSCKTNTKDVRPPPLPPRIVVGTRRHDSTSDSGLDEGSWCSTPSRDSVDLKWNNIHCSTASLPRCFTNPPTVTHRKLSQDSSQEKSKGKGSTLNVFRKRIKSESRAVVTKEPKSTRLYSDMSQSTKFLPMPPKKKFEFNITPSKSLSLIKNSRVGRAFLKNVKSSSGSVKNDIAKSCEFLNANDSDEIEDVASHRCSRSFEHLKVDRLSSDKVDGKSDDTAVEHGDADNGLDLSLMYANDVNLSMPQELFDLILKDDMIGFKLRQRGLPLPQESHYMPMSPRPKPAEEQQYVVMSSPKVSILDQIRFFETS